MSTIESKTGDSPTNEQPATKMDTHKLIKKQITYSEGLQTNFFHSNDNTTLITTASMIAHTNEYNNSHGSDKANPSVVVNGHNRMTNRTNSFSNQLMPTNNQHPDHSQNHHNQEQSNKLYSTCSVVESDSNFLSDLHHDNKLHRSKEVENLHDEQLEYSQEDKKNEMDDLLHHKSHIMRTAEVENLNELVNDD